MKRRFIAKAFVTAMLIMLLAALCGVGAYAASSASDFKFSNYTITEYVGDGGDVVIPETIGGVKVKEIGNSAFENCDNITSITIPDRVTSIGNNAFYGCSRLKSITIPDSVTSIGFDAFYKCDNLDSVYISDVAAWCIITFKTEYSNPLYTGAALYINKVLTTEITIPCIVTSIEDYAFFGCSSLTSIIIPEGVTSIGDYAFFGCSSLTSVKIPEGVTSIGDYAFFDCSSLTSVKIPEGATSIGDSAFRYCNNLTSITIPDSVTSVGSSIFSYCSSLRSMIIPEGVTSIGAGTFENCSNLTSITIPDSITSIGGFAFYECPNIDYVYISDVAAWCNITFNADNSNPLYNGAALYINKVLATEITIPNGVKSIGDYAFYQCESLASVIIPESVTSIGDNAFRYCSNLTSITIREGVKSIGDSAFRYCNNLTSIIIPDGVKSIGDSAFKYCSSLTSITIPDSVMSIGDSALEKCSSLASISIPFVGSKCNMTYTEDSVFGWIFGVGSGIYQYYNSANEQLYAIPKSIKRVVLTDAEIIPYGAFSNCTMIEEIIIPSSVISIMDEAFYNCNATLHVYKDTAAHTYAVENGMDFVLLDDSAPSVTPEDITTVLGILSGAKPAPSDISKLDFNSDGRITVYDLNKIISLIRAALEAE